MRKLLEISWVCTRWKKHKRVGAAFSNFILSLDARAPATVKRASFLEHWVNFPTQKEQDSNSCSYEDKATTGDMVRYKRTTKRMTMQFLCWRWSTGTLRATLRDRLKLLSQWGMCRAWWGILANEFSRKWCISTWLLILICLKTDASALKHCWNKYLV